jgi:hypothetical protein
MNRRATIALARFAGRLADARSKRAMRVVEIVMEMKNSRH